MTTTLIYFECDTPEKFGEIMTHLAPCIKSVSNLRIETAKEEKAKELNNEANSSRIKNNKYSGIGLQKTILSHLMNGPSTGRLLSEICAKNGFSAGSYSPASTQLFRGGYIDREMTGGIITKFFITNKGKEAFLSGK